MPKYKCSVCNKEFEDKHFDKDQNKCILHCKKDSNFSNAQLFLREIIKITLQNTELKNIVFPAVDTKDLNRFNKNKITFKKCKFQGKITGNNESITPVLEFIECEFESLILWEDLIINNKISFKNSTFKDKFIVNKCTFNDNVNLEEVVYEHVADFSDSTFKNKISQKYTLYEGYATFRDVIFEKKLDLRDTIFYDKVNFINARKNETDEIIDVANRETARIIKDSFEQQNNIIEANKFYALEMKEREKELEEDKKNGKNLFEWLVFKIHGLASNHSQDWLLSLFWIFSFTFSFVIQHYVNCYLLTNTLEYILVDIFIFLSFLYGSYLIIEHEKINKFWYVGIFYVIYGFFIKDWKLSIFSNQLNPFSIMTGKEYLTFGGLIYKIIIAYLIYQLIISIRQNTRRK